MLHHPVLLFPNDCNISRHKPIPCPCRGFNALQTLERKKQHCLHRVSLDCEATPLFVNNGVSLYCGTNPLFIHAGVFTANPQSTMGFFCTLELPHSLSMQVSQQTMVHKGFHCTVEQTHSLSMQGVSQQTHSPQGVSLYCETAPFFVHAGGMGGGGFTANSSSIRGFTVLWNIPLFHCPCKGFHSKPTVHKRLHCI